MKPAPRVACLVGLGLTAAVAVSSGPPDPALDDLVVRELCVGSSNEALVVLSNRGAASIPGPTAVALTIQVPGQAPSSWRATAPALPAGGRSTVRFQEIEVPRAADVLLRAELDPDREVDDADRSNNTASIMVRASQPCAGSRRGMRIPK